MTHEPIASAMLETLFKAASGDDQARESLVGVLQSRLKALTNRVRQAHGADAWSDDDPYLQASAGALRDVFQDPHTTPRAIMSAAAETLRRAMTDLFDREAMSSLPTRQSPPDSRTEVLAPGSSARRWQVFLAGIDQLPRGQREVFHLAWFVGLQPRVVSRLIGRSQRSAKQIWSEARGFVRDFTARASSPEATDPATTGHAA